MTVEIENPISSTKELLRQSKQARSRQKFDAILDTALILIHLKGYEQVSMREIARECMFSVQAQPRGNPADCFTHKVVDFPACKIGT